MECLVNKDHVEKRCSEMCAMRVELLTKSVMTALDMHLHFASHEHFQGTSGQRGSPGDPGDAGVPVSSVCIYTW